MNGDDSYDDAQIQQAIDDLRSGGVPLPVELINRLSDGHRSWYLRAIGAEQLAVQSKLRRDWLSKPSLSGLAPPEGFMVFDWVPDVPDNISEITGDVDE